MRSEDEIRKHMKDMEDISAPGCRCINCMGNIAAAQALKWALGERENDPHLMEELAATAARKRSERSGK